MGSFRSSSIGPLFAALVALGCSSGGHTAAGADGGGTSGSGTSGGGGTAGGHANGSGGANGKSGGPPAGLPDVPGVPDTSVKTALPALPAMVNVLATAVDDNVDIKFDPIDGARDYRVYVLPNDSDVSSDTSGHVTVKNAVYRCGGDRQLPAVTMDGAPQVKSGAVTTLVDGQDVDGYKRTLPDATLGYVYTTPGAGRVPVYAVGDPGAKADNDCYFMRWTASRSKKYVSESDHTTLVSQRWRDDGVVFYVPETAGADTRPVYTSTSKDALTRYYFIDGPEAAVRATKDVAFQVLSSGADTSTKPLMRAFYQNGCGQSHDELVAGQAWFDRVRQQGDQSPMFGLHWSGLTGETTLVVEALADGCPYQGFLAAKSSPSIQGATGATLPQWMTLDELKAASPTGEVYVNGQHDPGTNPRPIARSFVKITAGPKPDLDWFASFGPDTQLSPATDEPCGIDNCYAQHRQSTPFADFSFMAVDANRWAFTSLLGELWVTYDDLASDTNGKFRMTPSQKGQLSADTFLHATMTVDNFTTARRYPQILISDQDAPVQNNMANGNTLVVQTFENWPYTYQVEVCDHKYWDVNDQCPTYDMYHVDDPNDPTKVTALSPNAEVGEHGGVDRPARFDVYASTKRVYLFLDQQPYGCADLPSSGVPSGAVTVSFGDVLYHTEADVLFNFHDKYLHFETRRHYDNLGFKSGVQAPPWDESLLPCMSRTIQQ